MIDCVFHKNKFSMKCNALSYRYEYKIATKFYKERYHPNNQIAATQILNCIVYRNGCICQSHCFWRKSLGDTPVYFLNSFEKCT